MEPRLRFAPSPTGSVHIGSLRTALYNFLYAKQQNGTYLIRVEDTDQTRLVEGAVEGMIRAMTWAGIDHQEGPFVDPTNHAIFEKGQYGPYVQSNRLDIYQKHANDLIESGHAYYCFCSKERLDNVREQQKELGLTPKYDGFCKHLSREEVAEKLNGNEPHVVRLKLPENRIIAFDDLIKGPIAVNTNDIDDQVLMKTDGFPTYHMAVVIDDHYMKITHVVRGDEWLISTPKHIYLYEAFGWDPPKFVHLPVILGQSKKKLSKREGDVAVEDFIRKGYLPEALVNYIALVGWSPEDGEEIMSMDTLVKTFSFERVSKSSGVFDVEKLNWMNNHYIKHYDLDALTHLCKAHLIHAGYVTSETFDSQFETSKRIIDLLRERLNRLDELSLYYDLLFKHHFDLEDQEAKEVIEGEHVKALLTLFKEKISVLDPLTAEGVKLVLKDIQKETGYKGKQLFMPVRVGVTGQVHGPDIAVLIDIIGKENTVTRLNHCLATFCK